MWIVWIESKKPHMWDDDPHLTLDVGSAPVNGTSSPVERIGKTHPQNYPRKNRFFPLSISWRSFKSLPIFRGAYLWTFSVTLGLLHSESCLSTKNRELSTVSISKKGIWGFYLPPNIEAISLCDTES